MIKFKEIVFLKNLPRIGKKRIYGKYWNILSESKDFPDLVGKIQKEGKFTKDQIENAINQTRDIFNLLIENPEINVITVFDDNYPKKLEIMENDRPLILYIKGNVDALLKPNIAFIGTRKPTDSSKDFEQKAVKSILDTSDRVIISGLALGCDKIAHQATVDENKITIAILPSGVNVIKPAKHKKLAQEIIDRGGCLISEYEPNQNANKGSYIERDSIVAAFSDSIFVVECGIKSGTMHTVNAASRYKRTIFTYLPENDSEDLYEGNKFILENKDTSVKVNNIKQFSDDLNNIKNDKSVVTKQTTLF